MTNSSSYSYQPPLLDLLAKLGSKTQGQDSWGLYFKLIFLRRRLYIKANAACRKVTIQFKPPNGMEKSVCLSVLFFRTGIAAYLDIKNTYEKQWNNCFKNK
jgi:hypothetical protein